MMTEAAPPPAVDPAAPMAAHTERIVIDMPPAAFSDWMMSARLEDQIPTTRQLPGVTGTTQLTPGTWGAVGGRRQVQLTDGTSTTEQVLEAVPGRLFRYVVWNYTTAAARPIAYAVGEFRYVPADGGRTEVVWTYAFRLKPNAFPGVLGALGRWLFKATFLAGPYAELMRETLKATKAYAEREP